MGLFDWLSINKSTSPVTNEIAEAQAIARVRRLADSALIKFIHYGKREKFYYDDPFDNMSSDEFSKEIVWLKRLSEHQLAENPKKLDEEIANGLQVIWWMLNTVKDKQSKLIFDGIIRGAMQYESKINQHMLSRVSVLIFSKILKEDNEIRLHILENLSNHILIQEDIFHKIELQNIESNLLK